MVASILNKTSVCYMPLIIGSSTIDFRTKRKLMGVSLENKLIFRFSPEIDKKNFASVRLMYKTLNCLTPEARIIFQYSFAYPYLTYKYPFGRKHLHGL